MQKDIRIIVHATPKDRKRLLPHIINSLEDAGLGSLVNNQGVSEKKVPNVYRPGKINVWTCPNHFPKEIKHFPLGEPDERPYCEVIVDQYDDKKREFVYKGIGGSVLSRFSVDQVGHIAPMVASSIKDYIEKLPIQ